MLAVVLLALAAFVESGTVLLAMVGWARMYDSAISDSVNTTTFALLTLSAFLGAVASYLLWVGARRSRRRPRATGRPWLGIALWISSLGLILGQVSVAVRIVEGGTVSAGATTAITLAAATASLAAMTAFTVEALAGARAGERPPTAWWFAGTSGLAIILNGWLTPVVALFVEESLAVAVAIPESIHLGSTILLLLAFTLGFGSTPGASPEASPAPATSGTA